MTFAEALQEWLAGTLVMPRPAMNSQRRCDSVQPTSLKNLRYSLSRSLTKPVRIRVITVNRNGKEEVHDLGEDYSVEKPDDVDKRPVITFKQIPSRTSEIKIDHERDLDWSKTSVRTATKKDVSQIAAWISSPDEMLWLGGDSVRSATEQVEEWIAKSHGAFLLCYSGQPVAFSNVAPIDNEPNYAELGRLLVRPSVRRNGFGSSLLQHLGFRTIQFLGDSKNRQNESIPEELRLWGRANPENRSGLTVISKLPFRRSSDEQQARLDPSHVWFEYLLRPKSRLFGPYLHAARSKAKLSQAMLSFHTGVTRTTINMVEAGSRSLSLDLLQRLSEVLPTCELDKVDLLFSAVGEQRSKWLRRDSPFSAEELEQQVDVWILTDVLAELQHSTALDQTVNAISRGYERWYFLPPGVMAREGQPLLNLLQKKLSPDLYQKSIRFFEAPELLCCLRIAVENPTRPKEAIATLEGADGARVPLPESVTETIIRLVQSETQKASLGIASTMFSLKHPGRI